MTFDWTTFVILSHSVIDWFSSYNLTVRREQTNLKNHTLNSFVSKNSFGMVVHSNTKSTYSAQKNMIFRPSFFLILFFFWLFFYFASLFQVSVWCISLYLDFGASKAYSMQTLSHAGHSRWTKYKYRKICSELEIDTSTIPRDAWCSKNEKKYDLQICLKIFFENFEFWL